MVTRWYFSPFSISTQNDVEAHRNSQDSAGAHRTTIVFLKRFLRCAGLGKGLAGMDRISHALSQKIVHHGLR